MPVVAIISWKGGVGKTTLTIALADFLSSIHARNILVVDVDPQANASMHLLGSDAWERAEEHKQTVAEVFGRAMNSRSTPRPGDAIQLIRPVSRTIGALGRLSIVASSPRLQGIEEQALAGDQTWRYSYVSPYSILQQAFHRTMSDYDDVIIDCPPSTGLISLNALSLASGYLSPVTPDHISIIGIPHVKQKIDEHSSNLGRSISRYGTIVSKFRRQSLLHQQKVEELRNADYCRPVWNTLVPEQNIIQENLGSDIGTMTLKARYGGGGSALYKTFEALAAEFLARIG